jgi:hypothetical protein
LTILKGGTKIVYCIIIIINNNFGSTPDKHKLLIKKLRLFYYHQITKQKQYKSKTKAKQKQNKMTNTSLYIPHVFSNIDDERIKSVIENGYKLGTVDSIDKISKTSPDGKTYNSVYIHFKSWNDDEKTKKFLMRLKDTTKESHIIYDKPWFWLVLENTSANKKKNVPPSTQKKTILKKVKQPTTPPNTPEAVKSKFAPGAPTKNKQKYELAPPECPRNLEQEFLEGEDETMNLVDSDYVYYIEQDNIRLVCEINQMCQEIERLRAMMYGMVSGGGLMM